MKDKKSLIESHIFLYMTEFFSGMAVMAVELGASRLLAPYFSSSQIVWTIIIGTIMIAMALGNIYGGKKADENPNPDRLYSRVLAAAVWIAAIPFVGRFIIILIADRFPRLGGLPVLYDYLCLPLISAGHCDAFSRQIYDGLPGE